MLDCHTSDSDKDGFRCGHLVTDCDNVRLHRIICCICCRACRHKSFIEIALCLVRLVTTCSQNDAALLAHGLVSMLWIFGILGIWSRSIIHSRKSALAGIATFQHEAIGATFEHEAYKVMSQRFAARVPLRDITAAIVHALLKISTNPRSAAIVFWPLAQHI